MAARRAGSVNAWPEGGRHRPDNDIFSGGPERPYAIGVMRRVAGAALRRPLLALVPLVLVLGTCLTLSFYLPERPSFPNHGLFTLAGGLAGLVLGIGLAIFVDFLDPTIKDVEELRSVLSLPVLAVMPYIGPRDQRQLAEASDSGDRDDTQRVRAAPRRPGRRAATLPFRRLSVHGGQAR